jgi:hypothetical protein
LLNESQTRQRHTFESWNLHWRDESGTSDEPILSVKLDVRAGRVYVARGVNCYVWEPFDSGGNVIDSRRATRWLRELVGCAEFSSLSFEELREELRGLLFQAVVGRHRLPLTSVEAPLPGFTLGRLAYFSRVAGAELTPRRTVSDLLRDTSLARLGRLERVKFLEFVLRATPPCELADSARWFVGRWQEDGKDAQDLLRLLRVVFVEVALSPYTEFVNNCLCFIRALVDQRFWNKSHQCDFLTGLLRQLGRHLSAYDLVTFHHNGANYPDALLLDAVMKECLLLAQRYPEDWLAEPADEAGAARKQRNRRGLRQGWLLRRFYEGHLVPDAPTSPGENARVLPPPHVLVSDEQIFLPHRRTKRLFDNDPIAGYLGENAKLVLRTSVEDLRNTAELCELGTALFLDRPLGVAKEPIEPDQTLMLSYEAFSRTLAARRLEQLSRDTVLQPDTEFIEALRQEIQSIANVGVPFPAVPARSKPVVSLQDAFKSADDFVLLRTTESSVRIFLDQFDLTPLLNRFEVNFLKSDRTVLLLGGANERGETILTIHDSRRKRLELKVVFEQGYEVRGGIEYPRGGLQMLRIWESNSEKGIDVREERWIIWPRARPVGREPVAPDGSVLPRDA